MLSNYKLRLFIAFLTILAFGYICSSSKDDKKEDTKKEETKKEDTKKEDTKKEDTKSTGELGGARLYFCEEYRNGEEVGRSDLFTIPSGGGYLTVMIDLRPAGQTIGVGKVELRITRLSGGSEKIVETIPFDVQPDWDYIHFDEITFRQSGTHKVTLMKKDGTPICSGEVEIKYR